jgi:hypothetical protein
MAERVGFEPTVRFPVRSLSRRVLSTAQSPLRGGFTLIVIVANPFATQQSILQGAHRLARPLLAIAAPQKTPARFPLPRPPTRPP